MRIALTGANGFLGRHLTRVFLARGWQVVGLVRNPAAIESPQQNAASYFRYAFPNELDTTAFVKPVDVLVHCAFEMRARREDYSINRTAAVFLKKQPARRLVFISSMSAHGDAESLYGIEKLHIESMLDPKRDLSVRPGFIIGDGGVFMNLARSIRTLPVIPLFYGGRQPIQTVHLDDLTEAVAVAIERDVTGLISYGEREPVLLRDFYAAIASGLAVKRPFVPVPAGLALMALRSAEKMGLRLPMTSENLLGLKHLIAVDTAGAAQQLGVTARPMAESLSTVDWGALCG